MHATIFYFTGTGNSLWVARTLAGKMKNVNLESMQWARSPASGKASGTEEQGTIKVAAKVVGIVFPVYIWGLPGRVIDFVRRLEPDNEKYYFALAVNGSQVAATLVQLQKLMRARGIRLACGFEVTMPSNYIPWGGPGPEDLINSRICRAAEKIARIAKCINSQEQRQPEKGPWWHNILYSWFYKMSFPHIRSMDGKFWVDDKCNACGICARICPSKNVKILNRKPVWQHHCEQCLACLQWCPKSAIQYGAKTSKYPRYHHPEIKISDMLDIYR